MSVDVWVKLNVLPAEARDFVLLAMVKAKAGCRHCQGRGTAGMLTTVNRWSGETRVGQPIPCRCLHVNLTAVRAAIDAEKLRLEQEPAAAGPAPAEGQE